MDHSYEDLPIGAEAGSDGSENVQMSPEQVSAGIQFLIQRYKRKTPFTDDEHFFINEFKQVVPVMLDSATELEAELGDIRNTFTYRKFDKAEIRFYTNNRRL